MMKNFHSVSSCAVLLLLLISCLFDKRLQAQEVEDEREFDYIEGSEKGPENWGSLKKEWRACNEGDMQSPVDLTSTRVQVIPELGKLHRQYWASTAFIKNRGHDIAVEWAGGAGWIRINSTNYKLQQSHWHSPSEHTLNGRRYAMELHMVHQTDDPNAVYKVAVVGMLYKLGRPDPFIDELLKNVTLASDDEHSKGVRGAKEVDPNEIRVAGHRYYRYIGSLTMPPCTEGVIWTINRKVRTVSIAQLLSFREAVHDYAEMNARPVQDLNSRWIYYHDPRD